VRSGGKPNRRAGAKDMKMRAAAPARLRNRPAGPHHDGADSPKSQPRMDRGLQEFLELIANLAADSVLARLRDSFETKESSDASTGARGRPTSLSR